MIRIRTVPISIPEWERVTIHANEEAFRPGEPVPDLHDLCEEALISHRLLIATYSISDEQIAGQEVDHPLAVSGAPGPYYAYRDEPDKRTHEAIGPLIRTYGFYPEPPVSLDQSYDYEPDEAEFEIAITRGEQYALLMEADDVHYVLPVGAPGDSMISIMARVAAAVFVLNGLDGIYAQDILPYTKDTQQIAAARLAHITRWQFETSRSRPLYA